MLVRQLGEGREIGRELAALQGGERGREQRSASEVAMPMVLLPTSSAIKRPSGTSAFSSAKSTTAMPQAVLPSSQTAVSSATRSQPG